MYSDNKRIVVIDNIHRKEKNMEKRMNRRKLTFKYKKNTTIYPNVTIMYVYPVVS